MRKLLSPNGKHHALSGCSENALGIGNATKSLAIARSGQPALHKRRHILVNGVFVDVFPDCPMNAKRPHMGAFLVGLTSFAETAVGELNGFNCRNLTLHFANSIHL